ncbi:hypothetical protein [Haladaptatus sp. W1]|uniref:hypothetical protein n=1 Tax=Haladaptatus sp. W1 TaxID=1897478 RepID=UPI0020C76518|nr:hypothetical protein [Haladaptatus sp. W1]
MAYCSRAIRTRRHPRLIETDGPRRGVDHYPTGAVERGRYGTRRDGAADSDSNRSTATPLTGFVRGRTTAWTLADACPFRPRRP